MITQRRRRGWAFLIVMLLVGCTSGGLVQPTPPQPTPTVILAPDFQLATLDGQSLHLADLRGRYVLLNFWATWCLPCRDELPYLQQLADDHADQLTVLGINMREAPSDIQPFVEAMGITFPILLQPDDETLLAYNIRGLPLSFVIGPDGALLLRQVGPLQPETFGPWWAEQRQRE